MKKVSSSFTRREFMKEAKKQKRSQPRLLAPESFSSETKTSSARMVPSMRHSFNR